MVFFVTNVPDYPSLSTVTPLRKILEEGAEGGVFLIVCPIVLVFPFDLTKAAVRNEKGGWEWLLQLIVTLEEEEEGGRGAGDEEKPQPSSKKREKKENSGEKHAQSSHRTASLLLGGQDACVFFGLPPPPGDLSSPCHSHVADHLASLTRQITRPGNLAKFYVKCYRPRMKGGLAQSKKQPLTLRICAGVKAVL